MAKSAVEKMREHRARNPGRTCAWTISSTDHELIEGLKNDLFSIKKERDVKSLAETVRFLIDYYTDHERDNNGQ